MTAIRNIKTVKSHLRIVKGGKTNPQNSMIENTWIFIHATLWNNEDFSQKEEMQFQNLIAEHYNTTKHPTQVFEEIIERVCLAKRFVNRKHGRYVAKPIDWLNIHYYAGLSGTQGWYQEMCLQRLTVPNYNQGLTLLAKAITKCIQEPTIKTIIVYRKKLLAEKQFDLLQIFNNCIIKYLIKK